MCLSRVTEQGRCVLYERVRKWVVEEVEGEWWWRESASGKMEGVLLTLLHHMKFIGESARSSRPNWDEIKTR